jgi:hypothetical protein
MDRRYSTHWWDFIRAPTCTIDCMRRFILPFALLFLPLIATASPAEVVEWDGADAVELDVVIAPGEKAAVCSTLARQQPVEWSFDSSSPVDFDIRLGQGTSAAYELRRYKMSSLTGRLDPPDKQTYCWTWSNRRSTPTTINLKLSPRP